MELTAKKYVLRKVRMNTWSGVDRFSDTKEGIACNIDSQGLPITGLTEDTKVTMIRISRCFAHKGSSP